MMNYDELIDYASLMTDRRDHWREKAETAQAQIEDLQKQLDYWQEVARNRKQRNNELAQLVRLPRRRAGFDGWLASVQAEAWNAGFADGVNYDLGDWDSAPSPITNPYQDSQSS